MIKDAHTALIVLPPAATVLLFGLSGLPEALGASADWSAEATFSGTIVGLLAVIAARLGGLRPLLGLAGALTVVLFAFGFAQWGEIHALHMFQPHPMAPTVWFVGWVMSVAGSLAVMSAVTFRLLAPPPKRYRPSYSRQIPIEA